LNNPFEQSIEGNADSFVAVSPGKLVDEQAVLKSMQLLRR
jgi:hypothetical protein